MDTQQFYKTTFLAFIKKLPANAMGNWGKMNAQQMVEHMSHVFAASYGKIKVLQQTPQEYLPKAKAFLLSDKEFRENTKGPADLVPEEPAPLQYATMNEAVIALENEIAAFEAYFIQHPGAQSMHPVFGNLTYEEWLIAHYKHCLHHAKQFGYMPE